MKCDMVATVFIVLFCFVNGSSVGQHGFVFFAIGLSVQRHCLPEGKCSSESILESMRERPS